MKRIISLVLVLTVLCAVTVHAETYTFPNTLNTSTSKTADLFQFTAPVARTNWTSGDDVCTTGSTSRYQLQYRIFPHAWSTSIPSGADLGNYYCGDSFTVEYRLWDTATNTEKYTGITGGSMGHTWTLSDHTYEVNCTCIHCGNDFTAFTGTCVFGQKCTSCPTYSLTPSELQQEEQEFITNKFNEVKNTYYLCPQCRYVDNYGGYPFEVNVY